MVQISENILSRSDLLDQLRKEAPKIKKQYGISRLGLFGSFARDEAGPTSDIDLLVSFEEGREWFRPFIH
ncbi:nucleotidyltransferase family protein [Methanospirillum stamsii]